ncbi:acyl-CoA N-acyltransferase [Melanomma pulvis-pyrius CBS 109.77]|uniref:N-alpha-acetyltransferase 40 n=1 Tax=Melanomma pulvis-pyrius CBS 109.77 TaxID=1314802 RepID=A0A6A6X9R7_9PLEO|nr:acyl-CoA N-acyltransferase [Melanomma pulvis-pyrius CBS 109.77]
MAPFKKVPLKRHRAVSSSSSSSPRISVKRARARQNHEFPQTVKMVFQSSNHTISIKNRIAEDDEMLTFSTPEFPITIELCPPNKSKVALGEPFLDDCLDIIESTSGADYKASSIGWHPTEKMKEMKDKAMMYLLVRSANTEVASESDKELPDPQKILGFLSFMFTNDDPPHAEREVVYIYELHLIEQLRGCGLGKHLIKIAERAARETGISKTMLTVFSSNKVARNLYKKLGYVKDECSPADREIRGRVIEADYVIMGKGLV